MASSPRSQFAQIVSFARPFWGRLLAISLIIIISSLLRQIPPQVQRSLIDYLATKQEARFFQVTLTPSVVLLVFLSLIFALRLLDRLMWSLSNRFNVRFRFLLRRIAFEKLLELPIPYYNKQRTGSLMSKLDRGASQISSAVRNLSSNILPNIVTAIISIVIVASYKWEITVYVFAGFLIYFILRLRRFQVIEKLDKKINKLWDAEYGHFHEAISSIRLVKSFASEAHELRLFQRFAKKIIRQEDNYDRVENRFIFANLFLDFWLWGSFAYIIYLGLNQQFSVGTIVLLIQYIDIIRQPISSIEWTYWEIKRAQVGARDYLKIINATDHSYQSPDPIILSHVNGHIVFKNVSFKYPEKGGQKVFENLNFEIKPGQTIAIVGRSGAGKTTLAHLLIRFFDPSSGQIYIDGHEIRDLSLKSLRENVGLVMQQSYLFGDTIVENLRYGKPSATLNEMKIAAKVANADEFIEKLAKKYFTKIGERGVKLSGGQQQRLSIARTVLKNPPILILDEATSSLDSHSEMLVQDALWKLIKGRTTIIIAHRLSTIKKADTIIVLGKQKILEKGTHEELVRKNGVYASLHKIQAGQVDRLKAYDLVS